MYPNLNVSLWELQKANMSTHFGGCWCYPYARTILILLLFTLFSTIESLI